MFIVYVTVRLEKRMYFSVREKNLNLFIRNIRILLNTRTSITCRKVLNADTHELGFILSIIGAIILMSEASQPGKSAEHFWGCAIFSMSLMFLYLASTLFYR